MSTSPRQRPSLDVLIAGAAVIGLVVITVAVLLSEAGKTLYPPPAVTSQGQEIRALYDIVFAFAVVIFLLVEGLIVWSVLRYRRKPTDTELPPQTHGHNALEVLWTVVPTAIVVILFVFSFNTLAIVDAVSPEPDVTIRANAGQFQWTFDYLDSSGQKLFSQTTPTADNGGGMAVPVGRDIQLELASQDVIHAFYVPRFLFKRDVVPGMINRFDFTVNEDEAGQTFRGQCAELCGTGHRIMLFDVVAMTQADYDAWVEQKIAEASATPAPRPSGEPSVTLELKARIIEYDQKAFEVDAGQPFAIHFTNEDPAGTLHDVDIRDASGKTILQDEPTIDGGAETTYLYSPLDPGTYTFICSIHPIPLMTGTLTVE
ncbi:MAG: cytochrome c oxidase subunit II [Chloroflexi bacterium]|nr:cytochrome c oxidase subunit II [Chloroflexota bacterium]